MTRFLCLLPLLLACESETDQLMADAGARVPRFPPVTDAGVAPDASEPGDATEPTDPCLTPPASEVLLTIPDSIVAIAPFGEHVYFTATPVDPPDPNRSWVGRVPITGGSEEVLALDESEASSIAADALGVYWLNRGDDPTHPLADRVRMLPFAGGPPITVFPVRGDHLVLGGGRIFLWARNERAEQVLLRTELPLSATSTATLIATVAPMGQILHVPYLLPASRGVYWTEHRPGDAPGPERTTFFGVPHGETVPRVLVEFGNRVSATTDETFVYLRGRDRSGLWRQDLSSLALEQLAQADQFPTPSTVSALAALLTDGEFVYAVSAGAAPSSIFAYRVSLASREVCLVLEDLGVGPPDVLDIGISPSLHGGHLYYRRGPNQIARVPR